MTSTAIRPVEQPTASRQHALLLIDPLLMLAALGLVACSLITLHGATHGSSSMDRQAIYASLGLVISLVLAVTDYSRLREYKYVLYGTMIVLNLTVFGMPAVNGSRRWIPLPLFQFQSSEFGKILLIVALAAFIVDRARRLNEIRTTARIMMLAVLPALIVVPQPDLGTAMVYVVIGFTVLFVAGTSWKHLAALLAIAAIAVGVVAGGPAFGVHVLKPYQQQRLTGFLNPSRDPRNQTYNITQSEIAIGSGEKTGRGTSGATQTGLDYLPAPSTDFVFAALGETYGFVGAALVLSLYALLIWRALRILMVAKNLYGTVIAGGVLAMLMFQIFINVGMTIGIMPITGVPLPLMSYGGSSVLVTFIAIGLLQSIYVQGRKATAGKNRGLIG
ncbi:MAG: rod shape-determining protein RodA [Solirubrobacteraceae bacterium]